MAEIPLVVILVQRGGPSTGLPTKVEQGDLLAVLYGEPGDTPKVVLAPATIEECFHFVVLARRLAEEFRTPVLVLTDANLATGVTAVPAARGSTRPGSRRRSTSRPGRRGCCPSTGTPRPASRRGRSRASAAASTWSPASPTPARARSPTTPGRTRRAATCAAASSPRSARTLVPPVPHGADSGDLLVVGWGSTLGAIEEAVDDLRAEGLSVASLHLRFLSPLEPGPRRDLRALREGDDGRDQLQRRPRGAADHAPRRAGARSSRRCCASARWSTSTAGRRCAGQPFGPGEIAEAIRHRLPAPAAGERGAVVMFGLPRDWSLEVPERYFTLENYDGGVARWCPGCGDFADPLRGAAHLPRRPGADREAGDGLRHRLLVALPALHARLRLPRPARARAAGRLRHQVAAPRPRGLGGDRRRRLLLDRRRPLAARGALQHGPGRDDLRQQRLRADQEADLADDAARHVDQHPPAGRVAAAVERRRDDARLPQRLVRGAHGGLEPRAPLPDAGHRLAATRAPASSTSCSAARPTRRTSSTSCGATPTASCCSRTRTACRSTRRRRRPYKNRASTIRATSHAARQLAGGRRASGDRAALSQPGRAPLRPDVGRRPRA